MVAPVWVHAGEVSIDLEVALATPATLLLYFVLRFDLRRWRFIGLNAGVSPRDS